MGDKEKPRILVVESSRAEAQTLSVWLKVSGGNVHCVPSTDEAVKIANEVPVDGAFIRWGAEGVDADRVAEKLRQSKVNADIPIIMLAWEKDQELVDHAKEKGATVFLPRPFGAAELGAMVGLIQQAKQKRQQASS